MPELPQLTLPWSSERDRSAIAIDEYSTLTARYGEPDSILVTEADLLAPIPVRTAHFRAAHLKVVFVPHSCVLAYGQLMRIRASKPKPAAFAKEMKEVTPCCFRTDSGWTTVAYLDSNENSGIGPETAAATLDGISSKQTAAPIIEFGRELAGKRRTSSGGLANNPPLAYPEMKSNQQSVWQKKKSVPPSKIV
jgi:hypothetical protein